MPNNAQNKAQSKIMRLQPNIPHTIEKSVKSVEKPSIEALFDAEESPLLRYAHGMVARREVAEEIVQDAFLKLYKHWKDIESPVHGSTGLQETSHSITSENINAKRSVTTRILRKAPSNETPTMSSAAWKPSELYES